MGVSLVLLFLNTKIRSPIDSFLSIVDWMFIILEGCDLYTLIDPVGSD